MHVEWEQLSNGLRIIVIRELCRELPFYDAFEYIQLSDEEVAQFMEMIKNEVVEYDDETNRILRATKRQEELVLAGYPELAREDWNSFMENEINGQRSPSFATFSISAYSVHRANMFLLGFRMHQDTIYSTEVGTRPIYNIVVEAVLRLTSYIGTDISCEDPAFERDLLEQYNEALDYLAAVNQANENAIAAAKALEEHNLKKSSLSGTETQTFAQVPEYADYENNSDEEPYAPPSKKKKVALKATKTPKTIAATKLLNKKLETKKATNKGRGRARTKLDLPPSSLRQVTNSTDLTTPEPPSPMPALFSPASTWIPSICSSPIEHPRIASPSPPPSSGYGQDGLAKNSDETPNDEQSSPEADLVSTSDSSVPPTEEPGESDATQAPPSTSKKPANNENKPDAAEISTSTAIASTKDESEKATPPVLEKLATCPEESQNGIAGAGSSAEGGSTPYSSIKKTPGQATDITDCKIEGADAKTETVGHVGASTASTVSTVKKDGDKVEKDTASKLNIGDHKNVESNAKTEIIGQHDTPALKEDGHKAKNGSDGQLGLSEAANTGGEELKSTQVNIPVVSDEEEKGKTASADQQGPSVKEETDESEPSTTENPNPSAAVQTENTIINCLANKEATKQNGVDDEGFKVLKKRARGDTPDEEPK